MSTEIAAIKMGASPEIALYLERACIQFGIHSTLQKSHFLGQIFVESNRFKSVRESLNYSVDGLMKTFGRHRISEADCKKYGRTSNKPANQECIANILYGGTFGSKNLGNTKFGDGWKFIGRGYKQLTGKYNYTQYSLDTYNDLRIINEPVLLEMLPDAILSAGWFWKRNTLNPLADLNDYEKVTKIVNGGYNGLKERIEATDLAYKLFTGLITI